MIPNHSPSMDTVLRKECDYSLQVNRWFLKPIGAWPKSTDTSIPERIFSLILISTCYCSITFTLVPCVLYVLLEDEDIELKLKAFGPMSHWLVGFLIYTSLLVHAGEIQRCVDHIDADWRAVRRSSDREVMLRNVKLGRIVAFSCAIFMQCGVFSFTIVTGMTTEPFSVGNETIYVHQLPCPPYTRLINANRSPTNEIILLSQFFSCFIVNTVPVGAYSLAAAFALHACGQLNILISRITEYVNGKGDDGRGDNEMGVIVEKHLRILRFIRHIEDVMNQICFVELVRCTLDICMLGYYTITEWKEHNIKGMTTYIIICISMCFNIFLICYIGEILTEQCKKVGDAAYMTNWYRLPPKNAVELILIISRSSVVIKITAGKLIHMSVATFSDVIRTSVAYLNLLRTLTT